MAMRTFPRSTRSRVASRRIGSLMPALALALLAALGGAALVIDRLALDTAKNELRIAAESAALAAARELANDDRLRPDFDPAALQMKARFSAARIAAQNIVAGEPVTLSTDPESDVRFGHLITDPATGEPIFVESDDEEPNSVAVAARCTEARHSAVPLPFRTFYAPHDADVLAVAEATINFHVTGLRSVDGSAIPTLPLAILAQSSGNKVSSLKKPAESRNLSSKASASNDSPQPTVPSWTREIEQRRGPDHFGFDVSTGEVTNQADGIPEITLRTAAQTTNSKTNAFVVHLSGDLSEDCLRRQIAQGWSAVDLEPLGGELLFGRGPLTMTGLRGVDSNVLAQSLRKLLGQSRVVFLYDRTDDDPRCQVVSLHVPKMVAGRVMFVREISECECEIVLQPAVLATRSAVASSNGFDSGCEKNKYIANLRLTN